MGSTEGSIMSVAVSGKRKISDFSTGYGIADAP
jgi:hypothetical protein